ncbi:hypothetical protein [Streptomyces sp. NPDC020489]|uniref:hypothetical protein n=1 Tax=Streptomyces sp. NPDC020489 TaxID=3365077 RepID=UPI0037A2B045
MRVVVREAFKAYINSQPEDFTVGQTIKGDTAAHMLRTGAAVDPDDDDARTLAQQVRGDDTEEQKQPEVPPGATELDVDGSVADVLDWVDGDADRAAEALALEQAKDKPRSTLVTQLAKITDA